MIARLVRYIFVVESVIRYGFLNSCNFLCVFLLGLGLGLWLGLKLGLGLGLGLGLALALRFVEACKFDSICRKERNRSGTECS